MAGAGYRNVHCQDEGRVSVFGCTLDKCSQPFRATSVVPDPRAPDRVIAVCASPGSTGSLVQINAAGECTLLVPGSAFPTNTYPARLALVEAR